MLEAETLGGVTTGAALSESCEVASSNIEFDSSLATSQRSTSSLKGALTVTPPIE